MPTYAKNTTVTPDRSITEIRATLARYGAQGFRLTEIDGKARIEFMMRQRTLRFDLVMPSRDLPEFTKTPTRHSKRSESDAFKVWQQACNQRWRELALLIKAKLVAIESGIRDFDREFLGDMLLPDGVTVAEVLIDKVETAYLTGGQPQLLMLNKGKETP